MENVLTGIAISIVLPIVYSLFFAFKEKEEKKVSYGSEFIVKTTKGILIFFLVWMIICILGMIGIVILLIAIEEPNETQMFWMAEAIIGAFFLLGALGFSLCKYNYLIVKKDGIIVYKMFKKAKTIRYSDITYINDYSYGFGEVSGFDSDGIPLFAVDHYHIGAEKLASLLRSKGYTVLPTPYPSEEMMSNNRYLKYKKKSSLKVSFWCFLIFGILTIWQGFLVNFLSNFEPYENFEVSGTIESYTIKDKLFYIELENNEKTYYVNNIVYDDIDDKLFDVIEQGKHITLNIAYVDEYGKYKISQIEIDDTIYLDMSIAEKSEYSNYRSGIICSNVFAGIGVILLSLSVVKFIKLKKIDYDEK